MNNTSDFIKDKKPLEDKRFYFIRVDGRLDTNEKKIELTNLVESQKEKGHDFLILDFHALSYTKGTSFINMLLDFDEILDGPNEVKKIALIGFKDESQKEAIKNVNLTPCLCYAIDVDEAKNKILNNKD